MNDLVWTIQRERIRRLALKKKRIDGRGPYEYRRISIEKGVIRNAEGSAMVRIGETCVVAGVKVNVGAPFPDKPDEGTIIVNAELLPLASPVFEPGPPDENAIELARVVDRSIRESGALDFKELCITEGETVYLVYIDIRALNDDGNLLDASQIAAVAALLDAWLPEVEENEIVRDEFGQPVLKKKLPIKDIPVMTTFAKIGPALFLDPKLEEERAMDARFSIATTGDGRICALQKGGEGAFTVKELSELIDVSFEKAKEIRKILGGE